MCGCRRGPRAASSQSKTETEFLNNNLTRDSQERLAGRRRSIVEVIFDQKESRNRWSSGSNMRVKHGGPVRSINENRRHPPRSIPNHMLPHGLSGVGVHGNALRNRLVEGSSRQTNDKRKHHYADERSAPRKRRATHNVCFPRLLHRPSGLYSARNQKQGYESIHTTLRWMFCAR
jgi:hypothetical protein